MRLCLGKLDKYYLSFYLDFIKIYIFIFLKFFVFLSLNLFLFQGIIAKTMKSFAKTIFFLELFS